MAKFVNPYNFIPLEKNKTIVKEDKNAKKYTGYLNLEIELKTPLIIPNTSLKSNSSHKKYSYYSYQDLNYVDKNTMPPVIPGSELRGCIRSLHEALNNSCLSTINGDNIFTRRVEMYRAKQGQAETFVKYNDEDVSDGVAAVKRGIIERNDDGSWSLFNVKQYDLAQYYKEEWLSREYRFDEKNRKLIFEDDIAFENLDPMEIWYDDKDISGVLVISEKHIKSKDKNALGLPLDNYRIELWEKVDKQNVVVTQDDVDKLKYLIEQYQDPKLNSKLKDSNSNKVPYKNYGKLEGDSYPIYYQLLKINGNANLYLSPAMVGRQALKSRVKDKMLGYETCDGNDLCPTCALFGMISNDKSYASKIRFLDATALNYEIAKPITLPALASPKFTNVDFYGTDGNFNQHLSLFDLDNVRIRGRKFYWHHIPHHENEQENKLNVTVTPVKEKSKFATKVCFEQITAEQLKSLILAITLVDDQHGQKIGMGKPLGYGSINIKVPSFGIREIKLTDKLEYKEISIEVKYLNGALSYVLDGQTETINQLSGTPVKKMISNMTRFDAVDEYNVCYPYAYKEGQKQFEWFTNNKKDHKKLPSPIDLNHVYLETNGKPLNNQQNNYKNNSYRKF